MFASKPSLSPLKDIIAKLHPPAEFDQREGQRLLRSLTSSFRKNLSKEHGVLPSSSAHASQTTTSSSSITAPSSSASKQTSPPAENRHYTPTDLHVRALLSNPLLSYTAPKLPANGRRKGDPMEHFDQAVAKGLMNTEALIGILRAKRLAIAAELTRAANQSAVSSADAIQPEDVAVDKAMAAEGIAVRVVQWLKSSGLERDLAFLIPHGIGSSLVRIMVQEGLEELVWEWLDRWMNSPHLASQAAHIMVARRLLKALTLTSASSNKCLDANYSQVVRADDMFHQNKAFPHAILYSWRMLTLFSTVHAWRRSQPSEALFNSFASIGPTLAGAGPEVDDRTLMVERAHLDLYHPTRPDAVFAMRLLESPQLVDSLASLYTSSRPKENSVTDDNKGREQIAIDRFLMMATDAAQHYSNTGQVSHAQWIQKMILEKFGGWNKHINRLQLIGNPMDEFRLSTG